MIGEPSTCEGIASPNMDMVSSSPPRLQRGRIAHLESLYANLLSLVGEDSILIDKASSQMKKTLELVSSLKAHSMDAFDASNAFVSVHNGFSNTLKRAKPIIVCSKKTSKRKENPPLAHAFISQPKVKPLSMQEKLNKDTMKYG